MRFFYALPLLIGVELVTTFPGPGIPHYFGLLCVGIWSMWTWQLLRERRKTTVIEFTTQKETRP